MKTDLASELSHNQLMYTAWDVRATQVSTHARPECDRFVAHLLDMEILPEDEFTSFEPPARVLC